MSLLDSLPSVFHDPPPAYAFEVSEAGIAFAPSNGTDIQFHEIEPGVISVSPARDNVLIPEVFAAHVAALVPRNGKRRTAALILPDHSARVQVLDFDSFPTDPEEQRALIRFRVRKSVPFDVESAAVSYCVQPAASHRAKSMWWRPSCRSKSSPATRLLSAPPATGPAWSPRRRSRP